ncbi:MAG TPA: HEPN domain-containing protein [Candidatus Wujingus californicus]|uniref:HEPN domain-containing protein n=1 Tax=Candidatus Wujingus californicus TaxID=3367618 RepID=UPI002713634B|nr:HEPN domain-containing protein [Planctomycetota bacterium]MDO8094885.1 HEPN domain-containing protein [Candidatus Brocadiales bacterium]HLG30436.1 HEPN domain-containing protein [Candidatus Brocadiales bacterium]
MAKSLQEWLRQADYDINTAEYMFNGGRYFYTIFMCHLSMEKALKGLYLERLKEIPPKTHNLIYLLNKMGIKPEEPIGKFLVKLNEASVVTRYPEELSTLQKDFTQPVANDILSKSKEVLQWIKAQF